MPFISVDDEVAKKSFTLVENKFITKYLPVLEPMAVKVYLYSVYLYQSGKNSFTLRDLAGSLNITEEEAQQYFDYLEEFELVAVLSCIPFEVKILDAENVYGTPKKFKPEKYSDFTKAVQEILKGRMITPNEFREYFYLLEEYGFEQNALVMIINYCVNLKGDDIRYAYIKKVAKSFADEGATTAEKVDAKLCDYTSSTSAIINIFNAVDIKRRPDIDDDKLYKKWTEQLGFEDASIIAAAKLLKIKSMDKLDNSLEELYKNRKFDKKEIEDYFKTKNSVYELAVNLAKNLGVYMQNAAPYVENYVSVWCDYGYSFESLLKISNYCFKNGKNSFEDMHAFIITLYDDGIVADGSVDAYLDERVAEDKILKSILAACGLTRKVINWDREALLRWRSWNFTDEMLFEAAKISSGKSNPMAYMNSVLSSWKSEGILTPDKISQTAPSSTPAAGRAANAADSTDIERHYSALRQNAERKAEQTLARATADLVYGRYRKELNDLSIKLAFAEMKDPKAAKELAAKIAETEKLADKRLAELGIDKADFVPKYSCPLCNDTGYLKDGTSCECLERFLKNING